MPERLSASVRVRMPDNSLWEVPAKHLAVAYATEQAQSACGGDRKDPRYQQAYDEAYARIYDDDTFLVAWSQVHISWEWVAPLAICLEPPSAPSYALRWATGHLAVERR